MKIPNMPGEFAFPCLYLDPEYFGWELSKKFFFTFQEAQDTYRRFIVKWPVEVYEDGSVYVPAEEEIAP